VNDAGVYGAVAGFGGVKVALLESRLADETAAMVKRLGGEPVSAPSLEEAPVDADEAIAELVERLSSGRAQVLVFLTGAAVARVFAVAERLGVTRALRDGLAKAVIVARGPKPAGALARWGVTPLRSVREPFTTADVLDALEMIPVDGRDATVVHYGEPNDRVVSSLTARGARVHELTVYEWRLPADVGALSAAIDGMIAGEIQVLVFTSQIQVRHLLEVAGPARRGALVAALNAPAGDGAGRSPVLVGAVGPTCAAACRAAGIDTLVIPDRPKLGPLLHSLARTWAARTKNPEPGT
jgi:uroporphyrinogen-III synthase